MTALKPIENRRVRGVASERYPLNKKCAHPECSEPAVDPHHAFPRSEIGNDSWFVEIVADIYGENDGLSDIIDGTIMRESETNIRDVVAVIPHVTGLCRVHHDAVEEHRAWIKLEDGVWNWYDLAPTPPEEAERWSQETGEHPDAYPVDTWELLGPLNPQPGSVEGKSKRRRFKGEARRKRRTISLRVPDDAGEDGAALLDEQIEALEAKINPDDDKRRPIYYTIMDALSFTNLNAGADDFGGDE